MKDLVCPECGSELYVTIGGYEYPVKDDISIECSNCPASWDYYGKAV